MRGSRRRFFLFLAGAAGCSVFRARGLFAQRPIRPEPETVAPNASRSATKMQLEANQKDIKKRVEKLFELAADLKKEVDRTDSTTILSIGVVRKAEEIEKLAKEIKNRAKG